MGTEWFADYGGDEDEAYRTLVTKVEFVRGPDEGNPNADR